MRCEISATSMSDSDGCGGGCNCLIAGAGGGAMAATVVEQVAHGELVVVRLQQKQGPGELWRPGGSFLQSRD